MYDYAEERRVPDLRYMEQCESEYFKRLDNSKKNQYRVHIEGGSMWCHEVYNLPPRVRKEKEPTEFDIAYDELYARNQDKGLTGGKARKAIVEGLYSKFGKSVDLTVFILVKERAKANQLHNRLKRFERKAEFNADKINYFLTQTYDDNLFSSEDEFEKAWKTFMKNMKVRHGWIFMGAFERGELGERLHWHGVVYIPPEDKNGKMSVRRQYSTKRHCWEEIVYCDYIQRRFGNNQCDIIRNRVELRSRIKYIAKYVGKANEKFFYSRGIQGDIVVDLDIEDLLFETRFSFGNMYRLFDDIDLKQKAEEKRAERVKTAELQHAIRMKEADYKYLLSA